MAASCSTPTLAGLRIPQYLREPQYATFHRPIARHSRGSPSTATTVVACGACRKHAAKQAGKLIMRRTFSKETGHIHLGRLASALPETTPEEAGTAAEEEEATSTQPPEEDNEFSPGVRTALKMLGVYKTIISPLLPPSCRYQPTCSIYATDAYKKFGVVKGTVLTAWRLMRCNPWGGRGYDPAKWPPPGLEFIFEE